MLLVIGTLVSMNKMRHTYSTNLDERRYIPLLIAVLSIGCAFLIAEHVAYLTTFFPSWIFNPPVDTMGLYGIFYLAFDRYGWKFPPLRWIGLVRTPNLSGKWH